MILSEAAMLIAIEAHGDARNKHNGELYILHPARVAIRLADSGQGSDIRLAIAWLHDALEDTDLTISSLEEKFYLLARSGDSFSDDEVAQLIDGIVAMTKIKGESNEDYYQRLSRNQDARIVKYHDIHDNFTRNHLIEDDETRLRMAKKYSLGLDILS